MADAKRRLVELKRIITDAIVEGDILGIDPTVPNLRVLQLPYEFNTTAEKTNAFMKWLTGQEEATILQRGTFRAGAPSAVGQPWSNTYVQSAYQKGIARGRSELRKAGYSIPTAFDAPLGSGFNASAFNQPFHADRLAALYNRTFTDLEGITAAMDTAISRTLTQGLMDGLNPRTIAQQLTKHVDDIGIRRATIMARTEVVRAHHTANIAEYEAAGVLGVNVVAEWVTAGDARVCQRCKALSGKIFALDEIRSMIPLHPQCRCVAVPVANPNARSRSKFSTRALAAVQEGI